MNVIKKLFAAVACALFAAGTLAWTGCQAPAAPSTSTGGSPIEIPLYTPPDYTTTSTPPPAGAVKVDNFGAVGDGITDDTNAMQTAIDSLTAGQALEFGQGKTYLLEGALRFQNKDNYTVYGQDATIKVSNSHNFKSYQPVKFIRSDNFTVYDLIIDGNRDNNTPAELYNRHNILVVECENFGFFRVESINANCDGWVVTSEDHSSTDTFCKNGQFINCKAENCFRDGISFITAWDMDIIGGSYSHSNGTWPKSGIDVEPENSTTHPGAKNILIENASFIGNDGNGFQGSGKGGTTGIHVMHCYFYDNMRDAILMVAPDSSIVGNVIFNHCRKVPDGDIRVTLATVQINNGTADSPYGNANNILVEYNIFAHSQYKFPMIQLDNLENNPMIRNNNFYDFPDEWCRPIYTKLNWEDSHHFDDLNYINPNQVIENPGLPGS